MFEYKYFVKNFSFCFVSIYWQKFFKDIYEIEFYKEKH